MNNTEFYLDSDLLKMKVENAREIAKNARSVFFIFIIFCFYVTISSLSIRPAERFENKLQDAYSTCLSMEEDKNFVNLS